MLEDDAVCVLCGEKPAACDDCGRCDECCSCPECRACGERAESICKQCGRCDACDHEDDCEYSDWYEEIDEEEGV